MLAGNMLKLEIVVVELVICAQQLFITSVTSR